MSRNEKNHSFIATIISLCVGLCVAITPAYAKSTTTLQDSELVSVVIDENDERTLLADVPANKVEEYKELLKDESFKKSEIEKIEKPHTRRKRATGERVYYWGKEEVIRALDAYDKNTGWLKFLTQPVPAVLLTLAQQIIKKNKFLTWLGTAYSIASILISNDNEWWQESAMMLMRGQIRFIRMTLTPNPGGYPAMYRKLERIK